MTDPFGDGLGDLPALDKALLPMGSGDVVVLERGPKMIIASSCSGGNRAMGKTILDALCALADIDVRRPTNEDMGVVRMPK